MNFGIITYILHKEKNQEFYSYAPYIAEMNMWIRNAEKTFIAAPKVSCTISPIEIPYSEAELKFYRIPALNFTNIGNIIISFLKMPKVIWGIFKVMWKCDHIHLRCPGNISFLGCFLQLFFPHRLKTTKYAGNWDPEAKQPRSYKLQKWILSNTFLTRNMKVLVYGNWPNQSKNILPFFTASFSENERGLINKEITAPFKFLFVGNLVPGKQPDWVLRIIDQLTERNIPVELHVYGDGVLMSSLQLQAKDKDYIHIHGNQSLEVLKQAYRNSNFLILPSKSEGWPKAVAEAMFFGCIPIATPVSCVPWMLGAPSAPEGGANEITLVKRGILLPDLEQRKEKRKKKTGKFRVDSQNVSASSEPVRRGGSGPEASAEEAVDRIIELINDPEKMRRMSTEAQEWSQQYTLERFEEAIKELLGPQPPKGEHKQY